VEAASKDLSATSCLDKRLLTLLGSLVKARKGSSSAPNPASEPGCGGSPVRSGARTRPGAALANPGSSGCRVAPVIAQRVGVAARCSGGQV